MDIGMSLAEAESVAATVRDATTDDATTQNVLVVPDDPYYAVEVVRTLDDGRKDTYTLYDGADWEWLRDRILAED